MFMPAVPNNAHAKKLTEFFGSLSAEEPNFSPQMHFIFLCYTNRCGSNYVAELFASSSKYNLAGEDLNFDTVIRHSTEHGFKNLGAYFSFLVRRKARNNTFVIKLAVQHLELLVTSGIMKKIQSQSYFVLIERADKLNQAISFALAFGTGKFTSRQEGHHKPEEVEFSAAHIQGILQGLVESYRRFDLFFGMNGIVPSYVIYEQLAADSVGYLSRLGTELGLEELTVDPKAVRIERQANEVNLLWRIKYLASEWAA
jgi:trehalose 2-sulfotransferase